MRAQIRGQRHRGTKTKQHAQRIHGDVDNGNAEFVDERRGQEVEEREEPPDADEERVVDDGVGAVGGTVDVVGHEGCDQDGADELWSQSVCVWKWEGGYGGRTCQARRPMERARDTIVIVICDVRGCLVC
jgi:hypothetical protein